MDFKLEQLTHDQQSVFDLVESSNDNIFVGGKPGVGKTVLIHALRDLGQKTYTIGAPTGLAALNGGGKTLHSIFMIPTSGIIPPDYNNFTTNLNVVAHVRYSIKHLIIDEISMVRSDVFDYIDRMLKFIKGNELPFGGIQIIAVGDFFQLPPVVNSDDRKKMQAMGWKSEFAFDAKCWNFKPIVLNEVLRQKGDDGFISILHSARTGKVSPAQLTKLNNRVEQCGDFRIRLASKNAIADEINQRELSKLGPPSIEFHANSFGTWPQFPAETILTLKVGAQVLIKKNSADRPPKLQGKYESQVVNGSLGIVVELPDPEDGESKKVMVQLRNGAIVPIYIARWEQKEKEKQPDGSYIEKLKASFEQMPLQLAWAISMHKSQGQSFEFVHVDPNSIFAAGQLYVALSRARSLAGLSLQTKIVETPAKPKFWASKAVLRFEESIKQLA